VNVHPRRSRRSSLASKYPRDFEVANKLPAGLQTIAVDQVLPDNTAVRSHEQIGSIVDLEDSFGVGYCHFRHMKKLTGNPCKIEHVPERTCFDFGKAANCMVHRDFPKRVARDACTKIPKRYEDAGLVHNVGDIVGRNLVL